MQQWYANIFGNTLANQITAIMDEYYRLATIRKPEFMGWNQIEPNTPVHNSAFDPFQHGDEIYKRIKAYRRLIQQVEQIKAFIPERLYDAYVELVSYPVQASAYMNEKMLYAQKSRLFAAYHLPVALKYASLSRQAYDSIISLTTQYNHLAHGKWMNMMDMKPRNLPVFQQADLPEQVDSFQKGILVWLEGQNAPMTNHAHDTLPCFSGLPHESHFIELFNQDTTPAYWHASANVKWIQLNQTSGFLNEEERITVQIVRNYLPSDSATGSITIQSGDSSYIIDIKATTIADSVIPASILIEKNTCVAIQGYQYTSKHETSNGARWTSIPLSGYSDSACMLLPASAYPINQNDTSYLSYQFYTQSTGPARITIFTLPTHAVQPNTSLRIAVMLDHGDKHVLSYEAPAEIAVWRENVLSNHARCMFSTHFSRPGWHELKIAPLDPGVIIDQILVSFQPAIPVYAIQSKLTK